MAAFLDNCRFNPTLGGTTDWTYSSAVAGYQSPTAAGAVNGRLYKYFAVDGSNNWELGEGSYNTTGPVLPRTTVIANSLGTTAKINFAAAPQVAIVAIKADLLSVEEANSFTATQQAQALSNLGLAGVLGAWTTFTPTITASTGTFTSVSAAGSYLQIGKMVSFICNITITTVGTAAAKTFMPLPVGTLKRAFAGTGTETGVSGFSLSVFGAAAASALSILKYDTTTGIGAGNVLTISGTYEAA